ncbi:unnamed protein product [Bursaphelenchus xylophilus]|uniref:(pine wood nematode) hypothetical protein n=1 Tax=Bursaphelenchus xylophilus TaxID=6326 RepID=A0A1I7RLF3_BURXY|nr:unnamed protein product [Bursaphelenchus xylophilus]CAG9083051.1 unnamed protein product [Bursaphelenchus xylophilus]
MSRMSETELIYAIRGLHFMSSHLKRLLMDNEPIEPEVLEKIKSNEKIVRDLEFNLPLFASWGQRARQWRIDLFWYKERVAKVNELLEEKRLQIAERYTMPIRDGINPSGDTDDSGFHTKNTEAEDAEEDEMDEAMQYIKDNGAYRIAKWNRLITAAERAKEMSNQTQEKEDTEQSKDSRANEKTKTVLEPKSQIINITNNATEGADIKEKKKKDLLQKLNLFKERMPSGEAVGHVEEVKGMLQGLKDAGMEMTDPALQAKIRRIFTDRFLAETRTELNADEYVENYYQNHNKSFEDIRNYNVTSVLKRIQSYKPVAGGSRSRSPEPFNGQVSFISSSSRFQSSRFDDSNYRCFYCDGSHKAVHCTTFFKRSERLTRVKELGLCELCLLAKCNPRFCRAQNDCSVCGGRHHRSLCPAYVRH